MNLRNRKSNRNRLLVSIVMLIILLMSLMPTESPIDQSAVYFLGFSETGLPKYKGYSIKGKAGAGGRKGAGGIGFNPLVNALFKEGITGSRTVNNRKNSSILIGGL